MNLRQFLILMSTITMVAANMLFQQVSDFLFDTTPNSYGKYYDSLTLISPEEFTFIIWAPIFTGMLVFAIYQALPKNRNSSLLDDLLLPTIIINIANGLSLYIPFGYNVLVLIVLLFGLGWAFVKIQNFKSEKPVSFWLIEFPYTIFFSWISVALIVTTSQSLSFFDWNSFGLSENIWISILVVVAMSIGLFITRMYRTYVYPLVLVWAFIGILATNYALSNWGVVFLITFCTIILLTYLSRLYIRRRSNNLP
ncbi:MAG: hypothetical protein AAF135_21480 [Bacteroidota bacterium]